MACDLLVKNIHCGKRRREEMEDGATNQYRQRRNVDRYLHHAGRVREKDVSPYHAIRPQQVLFRGLAEGIWRALRRAKCRPLAGFCVTFQLLVFVPSRYRTDTWRVSPAPIGAHFKDHIDGGMRVLPFRMPACPPEARRSRRRGQSNGGKRWPVLTRLLTGWWWAAARAR
jgi:hypothetical protein